MLRIGGGDERPTVKWPSREMLATGRVSSGQEGERLNANQRSALGW